jgi:hypothetical protein
MNNEIPSSEVISSLEILHIKLLKLSLYSYLFYAFDSGVLLSHV